MKVRIQIEKREMLPAEFDRMKVGFDQHTLDKGVLVQSADRFTFVAQDEGQFIGCASGLAYKNGDQFNGWCYLTDLFVEKGYRGWNIGKSLLLNLEKELKKEGLSKIWTWTAGYEAPAFYQKQGYEIFTELENWYSDGSSKVGLRKIL